MSDDGSGAGILVPTMMIGNYQGNQLKEFLKNNDKSSVRLEARFEEKKSKKVDVKMWYASDDEKSVDLLGDLGDYLHRVVEHIDFEPRFAFWACPHCDDKFKSTHCVSNGKYCAMSNYNGRNKIYEDLR